ncbi:MAG: hypothetical protein ACREV4_10525 [Gammaproteobacteria bacterium]
MLKLTIEAILVTVGFVHAAYRWIGESKNTAARDSEHRSGFQGKRDGHYGP